MNKVNRLKILQDVIDNKYEEVWQYPNGTIELRANGTSLPFTTYDRLGDIDQGAIVDNKLLNIRYRALRAAIIIDPSTQLRIDLRCYLFCR